MTVSNAPPFNHSCLRHKIDLITPSYQSKEMAAKKEEIEQAGILVLNEMGLDPGIDHMSAMQIIDQLRNEGHTLTAFESWMVSGAGMK